MDHSPTGIAEALHSEPTHTIREALIAMSYTESKPGHWLKPLGYQCLSYHEGKNEWCNWFFAATGKVALWESKTFDSDRKRCGTYLEQLKSWECFTRLDLYVRGDSAFELKAFDWAKVV